ncbi:MAG: (d)CMP kinase [Bdellovibrionales bacterium]
MMEIDMGWIVTIDGPAASGKSSVSRELAKRMGWNWVSTGAFYRGLAYAALQKKINFDDIIALVNLSHSADWSVKMTDDRTQVYFMDSEVTEQINREDVGNYASRISHYPEVRKALLESQRSCSLGPEGLVAEGRDCGTVVFPQAHAKVYLTADQSHRAARRAAEEGGSAENIMQAQIQRDEQDSTRKVAPLQVPEQAFVLDTTHLSFEDVVSQVENFVKAKIKT